MDNNILEIVLQARDEATKVIEGVGNAVDKAGKQAEAMSTAFKVAGGILTGVGMAGLATLKSWADAASADEATWASVNQTLQNVSERMQTTTVAVAGNGAELKANKAAIDNHIASLKQQILTYQVQGGNHKDEITALQNEVKAQQLLKMQVDATTVSKGYMMTVANKSATSFDTLQKITEGLAKSYIQLGFDNNVTAEAFAKSLNITNNVKDAQAMLAASADLARYKHEDLSTAQLQLTMAYEGNLRVLKQLGIELPKGAKGIEAIAAVQQAAKGQADAFSKSYAGQMEVMTASIDSLKESLGARLLPTLTEFAKQINGVIDHLNNMDPKMYDTIVNVVKFGTAFSLIGGPILIFIGFLPKLVAGLAMIGSVGLPVIFVLGAMAGIAYLLYTRWGQVQGAIQSVVPTIQALSASFMGFIGVIGGQINAFMQRNSAAFEGLRAIIKVNVDQIMVYLRIAWPIIQAIFQVGVGVIKGIWDMLWGTIVGTLQFTWGLIKGIIEISWGLISTILSIGLGVLTGNWTKAWQGIKQGMSDVWDGIKSIVLGSVNFITSTVKGMVNGVIDTLNGLINGANTLVGKVPGASGIKIPNIPHFDQGGWVPQTGIAMVHAGEFVLSKEMLAGRAPTPASVNKTTNHTPINIYATMNSDADFPVLANRIAFAVRNTR